MGKKETQKKKTSKHKKKPAFFFLFRKTISVSAILLALVGSFLLFVQTQTWYFLTTSKEQVDFAKADGKYDPQETIAYLDDQMIPLPPLYSNIGQTMQPQRVLGESTGQKHIEVDLTNQRLYAFEGDTKVYDFAISSGLPWTATPPGEYLIWTKLRYVRMRGGSQALGNYYDLPNVPFTMFFYNDKEPKWRGFALHGAYWHNNFGHPMSHGCVNMRIEEAEQIYYWAQPNLYDKSSIQATLDDPGTKVIIYGTTPKV
ncbi:MAG: L,D-transpeptidase [Candidatus Levybacteria bacterium]|nr:L,D-transpeptidase [Candidatus Levybacteria bacterium]